MKKLVFRNPYVEEFRYPKDLKRIVKVFADRGYEISEQDALSAWELYSDSMCAGWLVLGTDDDFVFYNIRSYFESHESHGG